MARATYNELIVEVRNQVDVDPLQAYTWLLDRARVMNAESSWNLFETSFTSDSSRAYPLPNDCVWVEAVIVNGQPFQRSTLHAMDERWSSTGSWLGIYAYYVGPDGLPCLQLHPPPAIATVQVRYVADVTDSQSASPPFPPDFDQYLVDGAIGMGLARMDERFDSAQYFEARFNDAINRLRRRRHGRVGRGPIAIRVA